MEVVKIIKDLIEFIYECFEHPKLLQVVLWMLLAFIILFLLSLIQKPNMPRENAQVIEPVLLPRTEKEIKSDRRVMFILKMFLSVAFAFFLVEFWKKVIMVPPP